MDNRRVLLAVLLSLAVLIAWQFLMPVPPPPAPPAVPGPEEEGVATATARPDRAADEVTGDEAAAEPEPPGEPVSASTEQRVTVETDLYRVELTNRGGQILHFELVEHGSHGGGQVDLVRHRPGGPYPFALVDGAGEPLPVNDALFTIEQEATGDGAQVTFRYRGAEGDVEKRFVFQRGGLFTFAATVPRPQSWWLFVGPGVRNPTVAELENTYARRGGVYLQGDDVERLDGSDASERTVIGGPGVRWFGLEDTYFLTALIPRQPVERVAMVPYLLDPRGDGGFAPMPEAPTEAEEELRRDYALLVQPPGDGLDLVAYWGAKKHDRLAALPYSLEETVNFGVFGFLSRWILVGLIWIHDNVVANYGWAIVLMTLFIKVLLLPLTHKSYVSMQKMQQLNPKMQAIRAKFRGKLRDKQGRMNFEAQRKMNEEIRELYSQEGVNPAGGCLPMLLQLPVLFAFYSLLGAAVELRGEPWMLWIQDLSEKDPIYALPIIMGATQFIQTKMTPMSGDPMQRRIMQMMPLIWLIFFLGFPSGLVLYWLTNNVLTIAQQATYNHLKKRNEEPPAGGSAPRSRDKGSKRVAAK
ncbi:MAG TPA: membrane protein insertase YidC [Thermoanaerobaculia bacterium]|nr:membrane protein insertase YidC [Thermoanaerobaculia bacterium]